MTSRTERVYLLFGLSLPLLGCAPKEYASLRPDRAGWLEADPDAAANAKEAEEPAILPKTYYAAGQLFEQQGHIQKAIVQYQKAIAVQNDYVPAYNRIGVLLGRLGRHAEAEDALRQAVGMRPDWAFLRNNLGFEYMLQERWSDAEAELRNALRLKPDFARAHNNLGVVLAKMGRYDEALAEFQEAMPEADALYNLGMMYRNQNKYPEAADAFERAVSLVPTFEEARGQLAMVAPHQNWEPIQRPTVTYAQADTALAAAPATPVITFPAAETMNPIIVAPAAAISSPAYQHREPSIAAVESVPVVADPIDQPPPAAAQPVDPWILVVEAVPVEEPIVVSEPVEAFATAPWVEVTALPPIYEHPPAWAFAVPTEDGQDPCEESDDSEPIESLAEWAVEPAAPAWEEPLELLGWLREALRTIAALAPAGPGDDAISPLTDAAEAFEAEQVTSSPAVLTEEALAVVCDFSTDGPELFEPAGDWREFSAGFDASLVFLRLPRTGQIDESPAIEISFAFGE